MRPISILNIYYLLINFMQNGYYTFNEKVKCVFSDSKHKSEKFVISGTTIPRVWYLWYMWYLPEKFNNRAIKAQTFLPQIPGILVQSINF